MKSLKKSYKIILLCLAVGVLACCLCGCQKVDKTNSFFSYSKLDKATFQYDASHDQTNVVFETTITNETIYNITDFSVTFNLYSGDTFLRKETLYYGKDVKHGEVYTGRFRFTADGNITAIELDSWNAEHTTLWKSYQGLFITCIVLLSIGIIIYVIFMIIDDLDFEEPWEEIGWFFEDQAAWFFPLIASVGLGVLLPLCLKDLLSWVSILIVLGTIIGFLLLMLIAHIIKAIVDFFIDLSDYHCERRGGSRRSTHTYEEDEEDEEEYFDPEIEDVADYVEDEEALVLFPNSKLREYCACNGIRGYSKLNKEGLVNLIIENNQSKKKENNSKKGHVSKKQESKPSGNAVEELNKLIGLESVKTQLKRIRALLLKNKEVGAPMNLHMCFYGNPGTGKTMVARLIADIFHEIGVLPTNKLVETDRAGLCGKYLGETSHLTHQTVKKAMGGVLFIDEAYSLCVESSQEDYGKEAIAALLKDMEDYKGKFCVILAGYRKETERMIELNPGFDSRINRKIDFPDYTIDEQLQILDMMLKKTKYSIAGDAREELANILDMLAKKDNFANARTIRNVLDSLIEIQAVRTLEDDDPANDTDRIILLEDVLVYRSENL